MMKRHVRAFTLLEMIVVVIIVGILSVLAVVQYAGYKENTLDKEAAANLKLINSAQRIYRMELTNYYPASGSVSALAQINSNLKLDLPAAANRNWNYQVWSTGCCRATRNGDDGRSFFLIINDADGEPNSGAGCP